MRHRFGRTIAPITLAIVAGSSAIQAGAQSVAERIGPPLSEQALRARLFAIADDSMRGRAAGSAENQQVTAYIADEFRRLGLSPAGEHGGYFQELPLWRPVLDEQVGLSVNGRTLAPGKDYVPRNQGEGAREIDGATVVYAGKWEDPATLLSSAAVAGNVVLIASTSAQLGRVTKAAMEQRYASAAAICLTNLDQMSLDQRRLVAPSVVRLDTNPRSRVPVPSFFHVGEAVAAELVGSPLADAHPGQLGAVLHGGIRFVALATPARNVIAMLPGSDARLASEYVVIGAHNDHLGATRYAKDRDSTRAFNVEYRRRLIAMNGAVSDSMKAAIGGSIHVSMDSIRRVHPVVRLDSVYNGADDDGSGTAALIEIARAFAAAPTRPKRSILFISHTAEEMGDLGSQWFTGHPTVPLDSMDAMINLDMIGRGGVQDERNGGPNYLALVGTRRLSTELGDLVETTSRTGGFGWVFDYSYDAPGHAEQVYCRSDHQSYARFGIPIAFLFTGYHADYHELTDEPQYVDYVKLSKVSRFAFELSRSIADMDHRVIVNKPKPDPKAKCVQ